MSEMSDTRSCPAAYRAADYKLLNRVSGRTCCQGTCCFREDLLEGRELPWELHLLAEVPILF